MSSRHLICATRVKWPQLEEDSRVSNITQAHFNEDYLKPRLYR